MTEFANRLKTAMEVVGMSAADLSRRTGISDATISRYLSGQFEPKQTNVYKISQALNVSPDFLYQSGNPPKNDIMMLIESLSPSDRAAAVDYIVYLKSKETKDVQG